MKTQNQEFTEVELNLFLDEIGLAKATSPESPTLDHLIDNVLEASISIPPSAGTQTKMREEKTRRSRLPLWFSVAVLSAFFMGSLFGFVWGKSREKKFFKETFFKRDEKIFSILEELRNSCIPSSAEFKNEKSECIEPLFQKSDIDKIAPKVIS